MNPPDSLYWNEGNIDSDPLFQNAEIYNLNSKSPCIDTGTTHYVIDEDDIYTLNISEYKGIAPDIGAFESDYSQTKVEYNNNTSVKLSTFPNPFNLTSSIMLELPGRSHITLSVYSITGQKVKEVASGYFPSGKHAFTWDGTDNTGKRLSSGVYIVWLDDGTRAATHKLMLMK